MYKSQKILSFTQFFVFLLFITLQNIKGNGKCIMTEHFNHFTNKNLTKELYIVNDNAAKHKVGHIKPFEAQNCITTPVKDMSICLWLVFDT